MTGTSGGGDAPGVVGLREFGPGDADAVLAILLASEEYMLAAAGYFPEGGDLQSLFYALPEGASLDAKRLYVITADGETVGLCDAVVGWPAPDAVAVGLFLVAPGRLRCGIGARAAQIGLAMAREGGFGGIRASCPRDWEPGQAFLAPCGGSPGRLWPPRRGPTSPCPPIGPWSMPGPWHWGESLPAAGDPLAVASRPPRPSPSSTRSAGRKAPFHERASVHGRSLVAMAQMTWKSAIQKVLAESDEPLHVNEIARRILDNRLLTTKSATPASNVAGIIWGSLNNEGDSSPFLYMGPSTFTLRKESSGAHKADGTQARPRAMMGATGDSPGPIRAFGISWRRDLVDWDPRAPRLMGVETPGASAVDFADEDGVYLLYDQNRCVYAGRTTALRLASRLRDHTKDRLNGRWDRFSWFGLCAASEDGKLQPLPVSFPVQSVIGAMEALLIEAMEPALNRRQGDGIASREFLQVEDPRLVDKRKAAMMHDIAARMNAA